MYVISKYLKGVEHVEGFNAVVEKIISLFSEDENLSDITFLSSYPSTDKPVPMDRTYVTVGFRGAKIATNSFGDYQGESLNSVMYGRRAEINIGIKIYCPLKEGGNMCADVFSRLCDSLMFRDRGFAIEKAQCGKINFDMDVSAMSLEAEIEIKSIIGGREQSLAINK